MMAADGRKASKVLALCGGVGGAKLALGLSRVLAPGTLTIVVNTGDDFEHIGLSICPDLDTVLYTLAGLADPLRGWGRQNETWTFMQALQSLGGPTWFHLGDGDLAVHVERTWRLRCGESLSVIMDDFRQRLGVSTRLLPMSDDPVRTRLLTQNGWIGFQDYFVRLRCEPAITTVAFTGAGEACPHPEFLSTLRDSNLRAVVVCPSNPLISIEPILALPQIRAAIAACPAPVVAVSPIIGGKAVKGPTAKMLAELGSTPSASAVARRYEGLIDGYVVDLADKLDGETLSIPTAMTATLMNTLQDRENLAQFVLGFADTLDASSSVRSGR
jgi:LPPG:FO 2-phospho-L-lactate transferase